MSVRRKRSDWLWWLIFAVIWPDEVWVTDDQNLLPRLSRVCTRDDPEGGCPERMEAQARGEFIPDYDAWGWVDTTLPLRAMSAQAYYYVYCAREDDKHPNNSGRPYTFSVCRWCHQELPSLGLLRKHQEKLAFDGQADGS